MTERLTILFFALGIAFIASVILAFPVMWLWNSTLPELFGFKEISLWTTWKLMYLVTLISPITFKTNR